MLSDCFWIRFISIIFMKPVEEHWSANHVTFLPFCETLNKFKWTHLYIIRVCSIFLVTLLSDLNSGSSSLHQNFLGNQNTLFIVACRISFCGSGFQMQGTPVSERAVPVAIFETDSGILNAGSCCLRCQFSFLICINFFFLFFKKLWNSTCGSGAEYHLMLVFGLLLIGPIISRGLVLPFRRLLPFLLQCKRWIYSFLGFFFLVVLLSIHWASKFTFSGFKSSPQGDPSWLAAQKGPWQGQ